MVAAGFSFVARNLGIMLGAGCSRKSGRRGFDWPQLGPIRSLTEPSCGAILRGGRTDCVADGQTSCAAAAGMSSNTDHIAATNSSSSSKRHMIALTDIRHIKQQGNRV